MLVDEITMISRDFDVVIVGSGPAGVAAAERLYRYGHRILVLERGPAMLTSHVSNFFRNAERAAFIRTFGTHPWCGDFPGGMLLEMLGGRGCAAGAHLREFDPDDFRWPGACWPDSVVTDLVSGKYAEAALELRVSQSAVASPAQTFFAHALSAFRPHSPPIGVDLWSSGGFETPRGYGSSVQRLSTLKIDDAISGENRLTVVTRVNAHKIEQSSGGTLKVLCTSSRGESAEFSARAVVLAASPIESARLVLLSGLGENRPAVGRFLAEHQERRARIVVDDPRCAVPGAAVSLVLPPPDAALRSRFQIHFRGAMDQYGRLVCDVGGFVAMDPSKDNLVSLSSHLDSFGLPRAHVSVRLSGDDMARAEALCAQIRQVVATVGGRFITREDPFPHEGLVEYSDDSCAIQKMPFGRSYHEAGTLRMGSTTDDSATDVFGRVHGIPNLAVSDASLFPCVGVANPMLTICALAYRVADGIDAELEKRPAESTASANSLQGAAE